MAILTSSGRIAVAQSIISRPLHLAWGFGDPDWDVTPVPESIEETSLVAEVGRKVVSQARFCTPDPDGEIVVPSGRFRETLEPQRHIYLRFNFDFFDSPDATIREVGVFVGTQTKASLPPGQTYFIPDDIVDPGTLLVIERTPKFDRSASVRQSFEFVITF